MGWWIGYAKAGREADVAEATRALGASVRFARKIDAIRRGNQRWAEAVEAPILPNFLFIDVDDATWHRLREVKFLAHTLTRVPSGELRRTPKLKDGTPLPPVGILPFLDAADAALAERQAQIEAGQRVSEYQAGDVLTILGGPMNGLLARFRKIVETAHDPFPRIKAEVDVMGRAVTIEVDPINARRAV